MGKSTIRVRVVVVILAVVAAALVMVPKVSAAAEVHLTAAGDYGARATTNGVLDKVAQLAPDAHLALGDLAYQDVATEQQWCDFVKARVGEGAPFELLAGNHDTVDVNDGQINDFSACLPNQVPGIVGTYGRQYYMDFPKGAPLVRVIQASKDLTFEDGKWAYAQGDARYKWVSDAIDDGRAKGAKWIVVSTHYPCMSVGQYTCPTNRDFYDLMLSKKVDLVLHGHEHGYMRTNQLRTGTVACPTIAVNTFNANCVADSDGNFTAGQGTVFATVGTGGIPVRDVNTSDPEAGYFAAVSGLNKDPSYGVLDMHMTDTTLTGGFVATSGSATDSFTVTKGAPPQNQSPIATFTSTTNGLAATVNGSSSADPDGSISTYEWQFGDGATATGALPPAHTYATAGTYNVTLTVTDNAGATNAISLPVTVSAVVPQTKLAEDTFARTVSNGWGSTTTGGAWSVYPTTAFAVAAGEGKLNTPTGGGRNAYLNSVSSDNTDLLASLAVDKTATGGGLYVTVAGRVVAGAGEYRAKIKFRSDGKPSLGLIRTSAAGVDTTLKAETLAGGLTYAPGEKIKLRLQVTGTGTTTIRAKIWKATDAEPAAWLLTATDATAGLQAAGGLGLVTYLSSSSTNGPMVLSLDDLYVTKP